MGHQLIINAPGPPHARAAPFTCHYPYRLYCLYCPFLMYCCMPVLLRSARYDCSSADINPIGGISKQARVLSDLYCAYCHHVRVQL